MILLIKRKSGALLHQKHKCVHKGGTLTNAHALQGFWIGFQKQVLLRVRAVQWLHVTGQWQAFC